VPGSISITSGDVAQILGEDMDVIMDGAGRFGQTEGGVNRSRGGRGGQNSMT
jgi:hypothetical protein